MRPLSDRDRDRPGLVGRVADELGQESAKIIAGVIVGVLALVGGLAWNAVGGSEAPATTSTTTTSSTTSSSTSTTTTTSVGSNVAGAVLERCELPLDPGGLEWVQVESSTVAPEEWIVQRVAEENGIDFEFCDGAAFRSSGSTLMVSTPFTAEEVDRLDDPNPPASLAKVCDLRREMRVDGGDQPYRSPDMDSYFSDFILRPSGKWIGPNRCFPLLATDEEFGSRAALDRYFGILDDLTGAPADLAPVGSDLSEVVTPQFLERSGGVEAVVRAWKDCARVTVRHLSAPQSVKGFDHIDVHVDCEDAAGARKTKAYTLAMAPPEGRSSTWRLHWDPEHWGAVPTVS